MKDAKPGAGINKQETETMKTEQIGKAITEARKKCGMTQEQLAEKIGVTAQAVSKWENGRNLPDLENLMLIAELTNTPYPILLAEDGTGCGELSVPIRSRLFNEDNMFTRVKTFALSEQLTETYKALPFMRTQHMGQFRKKAKYTHEMIPYINHPLLMACQAHALGIRDDALLAAILLHDVVEDTGVRLSELPFSEEVRQLVGLVTFSVPEGMSKTEAKDQYYAAISENGKACLIKIIDRCNNVSTMAGSFNREKLLSYIEETEHYILPLADTLKVRYPEYSDAAFLIKYQIISILETIKNLLAG